MIGYLEGIDSERGIAWRTADSLRGFLRLGLDEARPEHSTISRTRRLIDLEAHRAVFTRSRRPRLPAPLPRSDGGETAVIDEVATDKGYHSNQVLVDVAALDLRTYIAEPVRGRRRWKRQAAARDAVDANRRRIRGRRGSALQRLRSERLERPNAHLYETGGMRRTQLRGHTNILKRLVVHSGGFNLGLFMRTLFGPGTARGLQERLAAAWALLITLWTHVVDLWRAVRQPSVDPRSSFRTRHRFELLPVNVSEGALEPRAASRPSGPAAGRLRARCP